MLLLRNAEAAISVISISYGHRCRVCLSNVCNDGQDDRFDRQAYLVTRLLKILLARASFSCIEEAPFWFYI